LLVFKEIDIKSESQSRALFCKTFKQPMSEATWRWKYHGLPSDLPIKSFSVGGFTPEGELVAHAGALVFPGLAGESTESGEEVGNGLLVQVCDVMISDEWRGPLPSGPIYPRLMNFLRERLRSRSTHWFAFGFPGLRPFRLGARLGFYRGIQALTLQAWAGPGPLEPSGRISVESLPWTASLGWFDDFWHTSRGRFRRPLIARDAAYMRWRYAQHPQSVYQLWVVSRRIGPFRKRVGWLVIRKCREGYLLVDGLFRGQMIPGHHQHAGFERKALRRLPFVDEPLESALAVSALRAALPGGQTLLCWGVADLASLDSRVAPIIAMRFLGESPTDTMDQQGMHFPNSAHQELQFTPGDTDVF